MLTSGNGPMVYAILLKLYSLLLSFENKSINMPHEALEIKLRF